MSEPIRTPASRRFHTRDSNSNLRLEKRDTWMELQTNAFFDLLVISQPLGRAFLDLPGYAYNSTAGEGITVFIIDTGVNTDNSVSTLSNSPKDQSHI
jgi:hypothetical protein